MTTHRRRLALAVAVGLTVTGCAGDDTADTADAGTATTAPRADTTAVTTAVTAGAGATTPPPSPSTDVGAVTATGPATAATAPPTSGPAASSPARETTGPPSTDPTEAVVLDAALVGVIESLPEWLADPTTVPDEAFDPEFLAEITVDDVRAGLATLGGGSWTVSEVQGITAQYATAVVTGPNASLLADIEISPEGQIIRLFFENAGLREPPTSMEALIEQLSAAGERTGLVVAEVADGACTPTTEVNADEVLPIASTFKLYVLGAVATAIADGSISWEQPVTIRPELRSPWVPLDVADGDTMSVRDLAQLMIEVSDNTATDHLIDLVGRDAVEAMLATFGHHDPVTTTPLLSTREMSVLKSTPDLLERYQAADEPGRRQLLAGEVREAPTPGDGEVWQEPRAVFDVEWFATPNDLCRALAGLLGLSTQPGLEPIGEIMSTNPGITTDPAQITSVWFKGGSEPGVLVGAWLAERTDGTWFVAAGGAASSTEPIDPAAIELVGSALALS